MATRKWRTEFLVNTNTAGSQDQSTVTALADGGFLVAWRDDGPTDSVIRAQRYDAVGVKVGAEFGINPEPGDQLNPVLVTLNGGNVQQDFDAVGDHGIEGAVIQAGGTVVRSQEPAGSGNDEVHPAAASLGANGAVAVWQDLSVNGGDIIMRGFNAGGTQRFAATTVNTNPATLAGAQSGASVAASSDGANFVVVWGDDSTGASAVRARVFDASGAQAVAEFAVSSIAPLTGSAASTSVSWLDENRFVASWKSFAGDGSGSAIKYAIFNADGTPFTGERLANSTTLFNQEDPVIATLPSGGFVIAWHDSSGTGGDNSGRSIRLQAFDGAGDKSGGEILVNTTTAAGQFDVALTALADGRVIVTWTDISATGGDTSGTAVRAQIVDPRDGIVDGTPGAETLYGHDSVGDIMSGFGGDDTINGLAGNDLISGGDGVDTINGQAGNDLISGDDGADTIYGGKDDDVAYGGLGADILLGEAGDDELYGEDGADQLDGGIGANLLAGGLDSDVYIVNSSTDRIVEASGEGTADWVKTSVSFSLVSAAGGGAPLEIEKLSATPLGLMTIDLIGNEVAQEIIGNARANLIDGKGGLDTLIGLGDSDSYYVRHSGTIIVESAGNGLNDSVRASVSFALAADDDIETLMTTSGSGKANINLTGNALKQAITGNNGNNTLDDGGGSGADVLTGSAGSDTYFVRNAGTTIVEGTTTGTVDIVRAAVSFTLAADDGIEKMTTTSGGGTSAINLTGNALKQEISGNAGANTIDGKAGLDTLSGLGGKDIFVFSTATGVNNIDHIVDFSLADDTIRLENAIFTVLTTTGPLASTAFRNLTLGAVDGDDRILYDQGTGALYYDRDGSGGASRVQFAIIDSKVALTAADFVVV